MDLARSGTTRYLLLVIVRNITAMKGLNSEVFTKEQLGVSGVLYYTLESGEFTATKKMIIVE